MWKTGLILTTSLVLSDSITVPLPLIWALELAVFTKV
jgi:hypothetical protein